MVVHTILPFKDFEKLEQVTVNTLSLRLDSAYRELYLDNNSRTFQKGIEELKGYNGLEK